MSPQAISLAPSDKATCKLCGRQFAKYNCPTCNVPYCSLTCFRSQPHNQCSEGFYKKEVELEIESKPSKTPQERMRMMELLKKFEEENQQEPKDLVESEDEDDADDLAERFQDIDMDTVSAADLWSKLTPAEQQQFLKVMEDPTSDLAQQLLASEELERQRREPWWDAPEVAPDIETLPPQTQYGNKPELIRVPSALVKPISNGPPLFYNMCALCIAYAFTTRHLSASPLSSLTPENTDYEEARRLISQLAPFLTDRRSTTVYPNLSSLTTDVWSRFKPGQINSQLFALLLRDTSRLVRPLSVTPLPLDTSLPVADFDSRSHPHFNLILVLSDLTKLFETSSSRKNDVNPVTHKLLFYAAHMLSTPSPLFRALSQELMQNAGTHAATGADDTVAVAGSEYQGPDRQGAAPRKVIIEEV
ncbi:hypothetical protein H0H81_006897 [Sphagnurus paluster]|uniref:HIT-type domain-containing protein n=1 Tax=Sphagnurus paluster TaxID=117069 RepID=A0A9P7FUZ9_9AGAR|nr:hypothetical protein H0H81_006897 [Sphagnurus paluster]